MPEQSTTKKNLAEKNKIEQNTDTPTLDEKETLVQVSRDDALKESKRVQFENQSIIGTISLKGAVIDDLTFKDYKISLENEERIIFLSPRNVEDGYFIEDRSVSLLFPFNNQTVSAFGISIFLSEVTKPLSIKYPSSIFLGPKRVIFSLLSSSVL